MVRLYNYILVKTSLHVRDMLISDFARRLVTPLPPRWESVGVGLYMDDPHFFLTYSNYMITSSFSPLLLVCSPAWLPACLSICPRLRPRLALLRPASPYFTLLRPASPCSALLFSASGCFAPPRLIQYGRRFLLLGARIGVLAFDPGWFMRRTDTRNRS